MKSDFKKARGLIFQIVLLLVLFAFVFILLRHANLIKFPDFIEELLYKEPEIISETSSDENEIFNYIGSSTDLPELSSYPDITVDNMNVLLNSLKPHQNFYWESSSEIYTRNASKRINCKLRISAEKYNVEIFNDSNNMIEKHISDGTNTSVTKYKNATPSTSVFPKGLFDFYSDASLVSIASFKDKNFSDGLCEIKLLQDDKYNLLSVIHTYVRNGINIKDVYGISLDFGVVLFYENYENDIPVFKQSTISIYPQEWLNDSIFSIS